VLNNIVKARAFNTNSLLNFGPTKDGDFSEPMYKSLDEIAAWMKINGKAIVGAKALDSKESSSVPATAAKNHRYLFVMNEKKEEKFTDTKVDFITKSMIKKVSILGSNEKLQYVFENGKLTAILPANLRTALGGVIDVELK